jgi:3-phosphoshikimate 1-carboxyvinyltransferase
VTTHRFSLPDSSFDARVAVPGDKSLSHRAVILSAMASGTSTLTGLAPGADVGSTIRAVSALGADVSGTVLASPGRTGWLPPQGPIDCGNSGTTMRLLAGALAGSSISTTLIGDESLSRRPMRRLVRPLQSLGARIATADTGAPPVEVSGTRLRGAHVAIPIASAQVRSAVALAATAADGSTVVDSPRGFRDHTERWLQALALGEYETETAFRVDPGPIPPIDVSIPADPSSAAFLWAMAAARPGARVTTPGVSTNPGRTGFLDVIRAMGAAVEETPDQPVLGDPVATITVTGRELHGVRIEGQAAIRAIDELLLVAILAARAEGETVVTDAGELRFKESDRIAAAVALARACGGDATATEDGFRITGTRAHPGPAQIDAGFDHRVALAAAVAAVAARTTVVVAGYDAAAVSWPGYEQAVEAMWS